MVVLSALLSTILLVGGIGINAEHFKLLFNVVSYTILLLGIFRFNVILTAGFLKGDLFLIGLIIIWFLVCILRSAYIPVSNLSTLPRFLGGRLYSAALLVPFFVFLGGNIKIINMTWKLGKLFILIFFFLSPLLFTSYAIDVLILVGFLPFLFLNRDKLLKTEILIINISFLVCLVFYLIYGHRNEFARLIYYLTIVALIVNRNKFNNIIKLKFSGIVMILLFVTAFIYLYSGNLSKHFTNKKIVNNLEAFEKDNLNSDSRSMVYEDFALDFSNWQDLLFGRGALGTTFSRQFVKIQRITDTTSNVFNFPPGYRAEIECGYFQIILKSGIIGLILFIIIGFRAIFLGLFRTKNAFTKICALIVFERFLSMIAFGLPEYSLDYIQYWLCVGACLSTKTRGLSNIFVFLNFKLLNQRDNKILRALEKI